MDKNEGQKADNYSKKLGKLGGNAYESIISYNLSKKFFMEDIMNKKEEKSFTFNTNKTIDINELKKEIIEKLMPSNELSTKENSERTEVIHDFLNQVNKFYTHQSNYDKIYNLANNRPELNRKYFIPNNSIKSLYFTNTKNNQGNRILYNSGNELNNRAKITDSVSSELYSSDSNKTFESKNSKKKSGEGKDNQKERHKNINEIEFDLVLKNIPGKNLINFISDMQKLKRLYQYSSHIKLKNNINYNVCVEITVQTCDIIKKKFPQLYKNISCLTFLKAFYEFLNGKKTIWQNSFSKTLEYFKNKTNFIDFKNDIVFITISNGTIESFNQIITELEQRKKINDEVIKIFDAINNSNYYMIYYPTYDDKNTSPYDDKNTSPYDKIIQNLVKDNNDLKEEVKNLKNIIMEMQKKEDNSHQTKEENKTKEEKNDKSTKKEIRKGEEEEEYDEEEEEEEDEIEESKKGEIQNGEKRCMGSVEKTDEKSKNKNEVFKSEITKLKEVNIINQLDDEEYDEEEEEEEDDDEEEKKAMK